MVHAQLIAMETYFVVTESTITGGQSVVQYCCNGFFLENKVASRNQKRVKSVLLQE
jgi:hypothetical protein